MTNPRPSSERMKRFYAEDYRRYYTGFKAPSAEYIARFRRAERADHHVRYLSEFGILVSGIKVLDVGCAEGSLLKALQDRCPQSERYAVEPNPDFGTFAKSHAGVRRLWITSDDVLADDTAPQFDMITIVHVLEHAANPVEFLSQLKSKLAPGGHVYVDVPDLAAYRDIDMLHVAHLFHFSQDTLALVARRAGLEVVSIERHAPPEHPRSVRAVLRTGLVSALDVKPFMTTQGAPDWDNVRGAMARSHRYFLRRSLAGRIVFNAPRRLLRLVGGGRS